MNAGVMEHTYNPSTKKEVEKEGLGIQGQLWLHNKFETSLYYLGLWKKKKNRKEKKKIRKGAE